MTTLNERFSKIARAITRWAGSAYATMGILLVIAVWLITGPMVGFSDTWQLIINTATTIVTNVLAFVILNAQNRDAVALHTKLDAILLALEKTDNRLVGLEQETEEEIEHRREEVERAAIDADNPPIEDHNA